MATNADGEKPQEVNPFAGFVTEVYQHGELVVEKPDPAPKEEKPKETPKPKEEPKPVTPEPKPAAVDQGDGAGDGDGEKPKKTYQERINELTRARREAERREAAAEARARELEAKLAAPKEEPKPKETPKPVADPNEPQPDAFEYGELDPRYIRAVAEYGAEKKFNELREKETQDRQKTVADEQTKKRKDRYEAMVDAGSKVHEDFYEKVVEGAENLSWKLSNEVGEMLLESEVGASIAYHLANNPQEAQKLFDASPREAARMFGKLETKFENGNAPVEQAAAPVADGKPAPKAPKAPAPVAAARGAGGQFEASADSDDFAAFEARAKQQGY